MYRNVFHCKTLIFFNWGISEARNWTTVPLLMSWSEELVTWQIPLAQEVTAGQTGFLHSLLKDPLPLKDISNLKENHTQTLCSVVPKCKSLHSMVTCKVPCAKALSTSFTWVNSLYPRNRLLSYHRPHLNMKNLRHARLNNLSSHSVSEWDLKAAIWTGAFLDPQDLVLVKEEHKWEKCLARNLSLCISLTKLLGGVM